VLIPDHVPRTAADWSRLFAASFASDSPTHVVRAPGRVNLIGEHTDYCGLPVFPMATEQTVQIAFRARPDARVSLANVDPSFARREFDIADEIAPFDAGDWGNYAKAAAQILRTRHRITSGFDGVVRGDIPQAAGLSSSSALVVACVLALVQANALGLDRTALMELSATGERYVGTQSGGMDQAICLGAVAGHASVIEFEPLRSTHVRVPGDWRFVIAHSGVEAKKSGAAQAAYNARVEECRTALAGIRGHRAAREWPETYAEILKRVSADDLLMVAGQSLDDRLYARVKHLVSERQRVSAGAEAMRRGDSKRFGSLMNASHQSLRVDYEVSCPELDTLVEVARERGATGARLTGAGFGGAVVMLARRDDAASLVAKLNKDEAKRLAHPAHARIVVPSAGATLERL
jgi:galactokinase